jgi:hypothetical protein
MGMCLAGGLSEREEVSGGVIVELYLTSLSWDRQVFSRTLSAAMKRVPNRLAPLLAPPNMSFVVTVYP